MLILKKTVLKSRDFNDFSDIRFRRFMGSDFILVVALNLILVCYTKYLDFIDSFCRIPNPSKNV